MEKKAKKKSKPRKERIKLSHNKVAERMIQLDMCAEEVADLTETSAPYICRVKKNQKMCISLPMALKIAKVLKTSVEELFFLADGKPLTAKPATPQIAGKA